MDKDKIAQFLFMMSNKLDELVTEVSENGCSSKVVHDLDLFIGDAVAIESIIKDSLKETI
ncbi:TPA: hypothetical protein KOX39_003394 [Clostridioides difficile]|nr:hypothetical protein [Clostridioides difficile]